jgi:glyoxylase-like metal-dependent hydrolase (beta-lactamase superfamily II)
MSVQNIAPGLFQISLGFVNAFLIVTDQLTLIDTGIPGSARTILAAVNQLGYKPQDIRKILITHLHGDHTGSLETLRQASGAQVVMHPADAGSYRQGITMRPYQPGPGFLNKILGAGAALRGMPPPGAPHRVDEVVEDGQVLDWAGGVRVVHTPGHTAGHIALLWPAAGGIIICGDAATNMLGNLGYGPLYEDLAEGRRSLSKLAALDFVTACFSHGGPLRSSASAAFRRKWPVI